MSSTILLFNFLIKFFAFGGCSVYCVQSILNGNVYKTTPYIYSTLLIKVQNKLYKFTHIELT